MDGWSKGCLDTLKIESTHFRIFQFRLNWQIHISHHHRKKKLGGVHVINSKKLINIDFNCSKRNYIETCKRFVRSLLVINSIQCSRDATSTRSFEYHTNASIYEIAWIIPCVQLKQIHVEKCKFKTKTNFNFKNGWKHWSKKLKSKSVASLIYECTNFWKWCVYSMWHFLHV